MVKTLDEFKAENAQAEEADKGENEAEEKELDESPQGSEDEKEAAPIDGDKEDGEEGAEPEIPDAKEPEIEDFMKGDDHDPKAEKKFTDGDIGKAKAKLKTKLATKSSELDEANARIATLEKAATGVKPVSLERPKRDSFDNEDDPDAAYDVAYEKYLLDTIDSRQAATSETVKQQQQAVAAQKALGEGEDAHYERVEKLVKRTGIKTENYQAADLAFRQAIDNAVPGGGDNIAAHFMGLLGEGSGEVVYNLGINAEKLSKLTSLLREDPNGLKATVFLTELKGSITSPKKRTTNAPKPAPAMKGDATEKASDKALKKRYKNSTDMQERINIRRQARESGVSKDTINSW